MRSELVIDRLAYWYYHPREWLKKAALVNDTYLLNSPFTFQSMEKHSAYCAMIRLGLKVPKTVLVPYKHPVDNVRWAYTSSEVQPSRSTSTRWPTQVGLPALHEAVRRRRLARGVPGQRPRRPAPGVRRRPGEMLMHLQATVDYETFARALSIGPETMVMDFRPDQPMHQRYAVSHDFLSPSAGHEAVAISRIVNAFFRWEFNSCEMLVAGDEVYPIDYANACPDVAVTSLHYYFPWAITALVRWSVYCVATGRAAAGRPRHAAATSRSPTTPTWTTPTSSTAYLALADEHFETERYHDWCATHLRAPRRGGPRLGRLAGLRPAAARHRAGDLPAARAGPVPRPLPRPHSACGWPTSAVNAAIGISRRSDVDLGGQPRAAETTSRASAWTWARCSGPRKDSA